MEKIPQLRKFSFRLFLSLLLIISLVAPVEADIQDELEQKQNQINEIQAEEERLRNLIEETKSKERTLANQIIYLNSQIQLTEIEIYQTREEIIQKEEEVEGLVYEITTISKKIERVKEAIERLTVAFQARIRESYKTSQAAKPGISLPILISGVDDFDDLVIRYKYLKMIEAHDQKILDQLELTQKSYNLQKNNLELKRQEVEELRAELNQEKVRLEIEKQNLNEQIATKDYLLRITQNDEAKYKDLLNATLAEQQALQSAVNSLLEQIGNPGNGAQVKRGDVIGIQGNSGMATGDHLHFGVYSYTEQDFLDGYYSLCANHLNPASYLNSGTLGWPLTPETTVVPALAEFNANDYYYCDLGICQVYGETNFAKIYANIYCPYGFHNGIDMHGPVGTPVLAAEGGIAYTVRMGQVGGNGVFIFHESGLMTLYWHLQ